MTEKILDSNDLNTNIRNVCYPCGATANVLTCLKRYGNRPKQVSYTASTYGIGKCNFCGEMTKVTQTRDFFFPDFGLIEKVKEFLKNQ